MLIDQGGPTLQVHRTISWCLSLIISAFIAVAAAYILLGINWRIYYHGTYVLTCCARLVVINAVLVVSLWIGWLAKLAKLANFVLIGWLNWRMA